MITKQASPAERIAQLRKRMSTLDLDYWLVPHAGPHHTEELPDRDQRLRFLTDFSGSAGSAIISMESAVLFVDGRYTLQAKNQSDQGIYTMASLVESPPSNWLEHNAKKGERVGFDPWLHTIAEMDRLHTIAKSNGFELVATAENLVDAVWPHQPAPPAGQAHIHPLQYAGQSARSKLNQMAKSLRDNKVSAVVLTNPSSICWTFNIRGSDVAHTPYVLAYAIVRARGQPQIFIDGEKLDAETMADLSQLAELHEPDALPKALDEQARHARQPVMLDPIRVSCAIAAIIEKAGGKITKATDPAILPRARKNRIEQRGAIAAHKRDGAAMVTFLAWLDAQIPQSLNELAVIDKLAAIRRENGERLAMPLRDVAFDTICGSGPNGAIVHYRADKASNRQMASGELLLVDSGGQYEDGTTDITRVIALGDATDEQKRHFTLVLKGMIAVSQAAFPVGTRGVDIDVLARQFLWQAGLDYAHGTGHGVGSYLSVHEGPQNISKRGMAVLEPGMIVSNEPGFYKEASHGIRIENLVMVKPATIPQGGEIAVHRFETLTLCPIDTRLIDLKLLTGDERRWLNRYHRLVARQIAPFIENDNVKAWLAQATQKL